MTNCSIDDFKEKLDQFLTEVPGLMPLNVDQSNSLLYQIKRRRSKWKDDI